VKYLPTREQLSGRLPERDFFLGLKCTLRNQYIKDIIAGAHKVRHTVAEYDTKKQAISISEAWMAELQKHPFHSSKLLLLIFLEKPGTRILLMKESGKLYKLQKEREKKKLAKRIWAPSQASNDDEKQLGNKTREKT
jgi:hypothetical protein